ncbi:MAG TPA: DUF3616 domain-containing protein [Parafilimonas sp.]|nr:DUF3616 domain-containing protein [Parafilimonas sp.]
MKPGKTVFLKFDATLNKVGNKKLSDGLSAVVHIGDTLWVANDESNSIERLKLLSETENTILYGGHLQFQIDDFIQLPLPSKNDEGKIEEIDIEGLDFKDGYLWLVGSHSLKRKKPDEDKPDEKKFKQLAKVSSDGNRFLLARIPLEEKNGMLAPVKEISHKNRRLTAAKLPGDANGNDLLLALINDDHLKDFFKIPGKDNGFDIEGLAVDKDNRIFIGLRGPVLRGYAIILELQVETKDNDDFALEMRTITPDGNTYRKHILDLGGLGIREISLDGNDMLILAGPTMDLDGPVTIFRWQNYRKENNGDFVLKDALREVMQVPFGNGVDHAEGMTRFSTDKNKATALLLVNDAASAAFQDGGHTLKANIFELIDN